VIGRFGPGLTGGWDPVIVGTAVNAAVLGVGGILRGRL
jgi:hypothetical protein